MWDKYIKDLRLELEQVAPNRIYWYVLHDAIFTMCMGEYVFGVNLPLPKVFGTQAWKDEWKYKAHNEKEIERVRTIWSELISQMREKLSRIEAGESDVEHEFKDGILFEDGKYGLRCRGKIKVIR